jgi:DNA/RNA endonuclease G (NUC1)
VIPQNAYNNGGIWNTFERYSRSLVVDDICESVEIISGPIYLKNQSKKDENSVQNEKLLVLKENGVVVP